MQRHVFNARWVFGLLLPVLGCSGVGTVGEGDSASVAQTSEALDPRWSPVVDSPNRPKGPANVALLPDGRVLAAGNGSGTTWYTLTPSDQGSYANGTWNKVASSHYGHQFAPSHMLREGKYFICGGEYEYDPEERELEAPGTARARCESFDPETNLWTILTPMPGEVADTASEELADGRVLILSLTDPKTFIYTPNQAPTPWNQVTDYDKSVVDGEGDCLLLHSESIFCGKHSFTIYTPPSGGSGDSWSNITVSPGPVKDRFTGGPAGNDTEEIGPLLSLHDGRVMILGSSTRKDATHDGIAHNGIYRPAGTGTAPSLPEAWESAPDFSNFYNAGDSPATVEVSGKVLAVVSTSGSGGEGGPDSKLDPTPSTGQVAFAEYTPGDSSSTPVSGTCPTTGTPSNCWTYFSAPSAMGSGNGARLLNLPTQAGSPTSQILVTGTSDNSMWLYGSPNTPHDSWRPVPTAVVFPVNGEWTLDADQMSGLTTGASIGDDAEMNTNYPIVYFTNGGKVYFARTYNFDAMSTMPGRHGSTNFALPPNMPEGVSTLHVSANGVDQPSSSSFNLSIPERHVSDLSGVLTGNINSTVMWTVTLSSNAPTGGVVVELASDSTNVATVPSTVMVPANKNQMTFPVTVRGFGITTISARTSGGFMYRPLKKQFGWNIEDLAVSTDGCQPKWTVTLSQPAPSGGLSVNLASRDPNIASVPATINVQPSKNSGTVTGLRTGNGFTFVTASLINTTMGHSVDSTGPSLAVGSNADGRLEIFYTDDNCTIFHRWQTAKDSSNWSVETALGGLAKQIAVAPNADKRLEIFYVGTDNKIYHRWQNTPGNGTAAWSSEASLGGNGKRIIASVNGDGRVEIFYSTTDKALYHNWQKTPANGNTTWFGDTYMGRSDGVFDSNHHDDVKQFATQVNQNGFMQLFYVSPGNNNTLGSQTQGATDTATAWTGPHDLGGGGPRIVVGKNFSDNTLEVFYPGNDKEIIHNQQTVANGPFGGEQTLLPQRNAKELFVIQGQNHGLDLFSIDPDDFSLSHRQKDPTTGTWSGVLRLAGQFADAMVVARNDGGKLEVFYRGTDRNLYHTRQDANNSSDFDSSVAF